MSETTSVQILGPEDRDEAVQVLCEAFFDYPVFRHALKDAGANYVRGLEAFIAHSTDTRLERGFPVLGIRAGNGLVAAAGVDPPKPPPAPDGRAERWARIGDITGPGALERFEAFSSASQELAPDGHYFYLGMIGVRPEHQGEGHGARLLDHLAETSRQDPDSDGVLLTTERHDNVRYYEKHGYEVLGRRQVEDLETWTMLRLDATTR